MRLYQVVTWNQYGTGVASQSRGFSSRAAAEKFAAGMAAAGKAPHGADVSSYEDEDEA